MKVLEMLETRKEVWNEKKDWRVQEAILSWTYYTLRPSQIFFVYGDGDVKKIFGEDFSSRSILFIYSVSGSSVSWDEEKMDEWIFIFSLQRKEDWTEGRSDYEDHVVDEMSIYLTCELLTSWPSSSSSPSAHS